MSTLALVSIGVAVIGVALAAVTCCLIRRHGNADDDLRDQVRSLTQTNAQLLDENTQLKAALAERWGRPVEFIERHLSA